MWLTERNAPENAPAGAGKAVLGGKGRRILRWVTRRSWNHEGSD